ncbi:dihydrofolate reductase family protein [Blastococcus sp. PRF04-17]|uniref:dihydrofolate reductase family protein n=1 Tax=Blastococcus sp. PRF04-17 TaxID=2933797 RepID=UPI001FF267DD|nr:dihydrofolate reductase family protein [Blastococcus sp. PRF04-17]UOY03139.1 dihydrofolate reductase family protein [Blastococcus sp. PRF04-17]
MAELVYMAICSLDGYVADADGEFGWAAPDEQVHAFVNDLSRPLGIQLIGRRTYALMQYWETAATDGSGEPVEEDFTRIWQSIDKIVYSRTLDSVSAPRTRLEREFDPAAVRALKESAQAPLAVGGPDLAASAFRAGLVDELQLFLVPVLVGGGTRALPDDVRLELELVEDRRFDAGTVFLRHRVVSGPPV